ncbi:MAG: bifunctional 3,4-dihydroxy-2-butanone-4-phosphate synthase/GTP cyclohydrolase II [Chloroflexi bacterium]|nr:bifunctional 3,4-dihydroxy-2-butanone-4-phosphate synthase/GTP cyclohydrolase II [Chloroflexota bacterium]|tara:strand:- start:3163 stop:4461 length:1299 start_codon:yes stop_codon:yes gene_type:complete
MNDLNKEEPQEIEAFSDRLISTHEAIKMFQEGQPIILVDDEDRENEGDIAIPAQFVTEELVNFMVSEARGLVCVPMTEERADHLALPLMTDHGNAPLGTAFTISVEAASGVTTGISAPDRARTINVLADIKSISTDFTRPGHIFPLRAKEGGVLVRAGQTEASVDLCRLAGVTPVASICEIMNEDGTMARMPDLIKFADKHDLKIATVADLIRYRMQTERLIHRKGETNLPTLYGEFKAIGFSTGIDSKEHVALVFGDINPEEPTLVRVHDKCLTGDVFGSLRCDCGEQLQAALRMIADEGSGVVVYMDQEGRGIGLHNKLRAYNLQDDGLDTVEANEALGLPAESRDYGIGAQILVDLGVRKMRLMTNNPIKIQELNTMGVLRGAGLDGFGLQVTERIPIEIEPNEHNVRYLTAKRDKMGHMFEMPMPDFG